MPGPNPNPLAYMGSPDSSETVRGVVELATVAETIAGTRRDVACTPFGVAGLISFGAPAASTTVPGIIEIATNGEAAAQASGTLALVPSNIPSIMASPGDIGGTTPGAGTFTTLTMTDLVLTNPLSVSEGGTGASSLTDHGIMLGSGTGAVTVTAVGTNNQIFIGQTGADPIWSDNIDVQGTLAVTGAATLDDTLTVAGTTSSGLLTASASATIVTGATALNLGADNAAGQINIGTGTTARVIGVGGTGANTIAIANTQTGGSVAIGNAMTTGTITLGGATNTGTLTLGASTAAGGQTINVGNAINTGAQVINLAGGASAADSTVNVLSGNATAGTITLNLATGNRAKTVNVATGIDGNTVNVATGVNTTAQTVNISTGNSGANSTVNILTGTGTAGAATLAMASNPRVTVAGLCDVAPAASRTTTIGGGTVVVAAVTDTIDIGPDGATTNADSVKTVNVNTGGVTTGQVLTNIATGAVTSGTHTTSIATGNRAAGTMALNIMTGTGTKTCTVGNADGGTTAAFLGPHNINVSQNNNTAINSGTSTGTVTIGNSLSGAITVAGGSTVDIDAVGALALNSSGAAISIGNDAVAQAINIGTGGAARTITIGNTTGASAMVLTAGSGAVTCNTNFILGSVATQFQMNGGAATDFIGQAVLVAGTKTVANTNIAANDRIFLSRSTTGGTAGHLSYVINAGADFVITSSSATDTSTIDYFIVRQN